jgi:hypothetical protein
MSTTAGRLRLGPLPRMESVKVTFICTAVLRAELERYAALHAQTYGEPVDAVTLIPHMLSTFMARDRGFRRSETVGSMRPGNSDQIREKP